VTLATNTYDEARAGAFNKGQLTTAVNGPNASTVDYAKQTFDYDANGMVIKKVSAINYAASTAPITHTETGYYKASKLVAWKTYDAGLAASKLLVGENADTKRWFYNAKGQLRQIPGFIKETLYEADGQTDLITYQNDVTTDFSYDPYRRWLTQLTTKKIGGTQILNTSYTRDELGRIKTTDGISANEDWTYSYNARGQLIKADNGDKWLTETFTYTENGNLTNDRVQTYLWDGANRLMSVTKATATTRFVYGADSARVKKVPPSGTRLTLYPDAGTEITKLTDGSWEHTRYPHMRLCRRTTVLVSILLLIAPFAEEKP